MYVYSADMILSWDDVDVVDGEVCLHLFVTRGKENCLKFLRVCLHAVPFEPVDSNFSHTY